MSLPASFPTAKQVLLPGCYERKPHMGTQKARPSENVLTPGTFGGRYCFLLPLPKNPQGPLHQLGQCLLHRLRETDAEIVGVQHFHCQNADVLRERNLQAVAISITSGKPA